MHQQWFTGSRCAYWERGAADQCTQDYITKQELTAAEAVEESLEGNVVGLLVLGREDVGQRRGVR